MHASQSIRDEQRGDGDDGKVDGKDKMLISFSLNYPSPQIEDKCKLKNILRVMLSMVSNCTQWLNCISHNSRRQAVLRVI